MEVARSVQTEVGSTGELPSLVLQLQAGVPLHLVEQVESGGWTGGECRTGSYDFVADHRYPKGWFTVVDCDAIKGGYQ